MSKAIIIEAIQKAVTLNATQATRAADATISAIVESLNTAGEFVIPGFGTFTVRELKARSGRHPATGAPIKVKASRTVRFKPSAGLREEIVASAAKVKPAAKAKTAAPAQPLERAGRTAAAKPTPVGSKPAPAPKQAKTNAKQPSPAPKRSSQQPQATTG